MLYKEPTDVTDYEIDWSDWLPTGVSIATSTWTVPAGITKVTDSDTDTTTLIRLSGGTWGETYELINTITAGSETESRSLLIRIQRSVAYCTPLEVRRRMSGGSGSGGSATITALTPAELEALIEQASRMFDLECGVPEGYFNPVAIPVATERTLYSDGTNYLRLPPYVPGSLNTVLSFPDGYTVPDFTELNGYLVITSTTGIVPAYPRFPDTLWSGWHIGVPITVSAIWGWRETPADVKMAVIELVINLHRETDPATLKLTGLEGQALRERIPPRVMEVAKKYRFKTGAVFV